MGRPESTTSRRDFLRYASLLSAGRAVGPFGLRLAALGGASLGGATLGAATPVTDYKALVCIFLLGGNDSSNMVLATDADSWGRYQSARNVAPTPIALAPVGTVATPGAIGSLGPAALGGVLPIVPRTANPWPAGTKGTGARTFALHPSMPACQGLFARGKLAVVANVGPLIQPTSKAQYLANSVPLPRSLFSHNDQQSTWQAGSGEGAQVGWGGRLGDLLASANLNDVFTGISVSGNAVFLAGDKVIGYQTAASGAIPITGVTAASLFTSTAAPAIAQTVITTPSDPSLFEQDQATVVGRSIAAQQKLNTALKAIVAAPAPPTFLDPVSNKQIANPLALSLQTIANLIATNQTLGMKRQVFYVGLGGFDTHFDENLSHPRLMAELDAALDYFYTALASLNGADLTAQVTTFTMSDFSRTFTSNGSGTDHGWGGHHLVLGGAVKGGDLYGQFPTVGVDLGAFSNPDALHSGVLVPTTSVDRYAATLGTWLGASAADLQAIFPNLHNFATGTSISLGFV
jgi:uncharacterized protein (DUF1501 family)